MKRPPKHPGLKSRRSAGDNQRARPNPRQSEAASQPVQPAQLVQIEKPIYGGAFLARIEGKAVFVPLTLPGEQVRIKVVEDKRNFATAEAEFILTSAPERTPATCPYFGACGGCNYQHANYAAQLNFKRSILRETLERASVPAPDEIDVLSGDPWAYRNRIRLAFDTQGNIGYRGRRSHHVIPIDHCPHCRAGARRSRNRIYGPGPQARSRLPSRRTRHLLQPG